MRAMPTLPVDPEYEKDQDQENHECQLIVDHEAAQLCHLPGAWHGLRHQLMPSMRRIRTRKMTNASCSLIIVPPTVIPPVTLRLRYLMLTSQTGLQKKRFGATPGGGEEPRRTVPVHSQPGTRPRWCTDPRYVDIMRLVPGNNRPAAVF